MKEELVNSLLTDCSYFLAYIKNSDDLLTFQLFINLLIKYKRELQK